MTTIPADQIQALKLANPQWRMNDAVSNTIAASGGSSTATFNAKNYYILIESSLFSLYDQAADTKSRAIIETATARDIFTSTITLTNTQITYNPIDVFAWNAQNVNRYNTFYWLLQPMDALKVQVTHSLAGTLAATNFPVTWYFGIQYYECRNVDVLSQFLKQ